jgi:Lon protease-like protein
MIQPDPAHPGREDKPTLYNVGCVGRITQIAETGDGRYLLQLTGIARFRIDAELAVSTPYRQCRVSYAPFVGDFTARKGEEEVDRASLLRALSDVALWSGGEAGAAGGPRPQDPRRDPGRGDRDRARQEVLGRRDPAAITTLAGHSLVITTLSC